MSRLIGLIGRARSGKDTIGRYLYDAYDLYHMAFADPIKNMLGAAFPDINFYEGDREATIAWLGKSPRQLMQTLGTEWGRQCVHPELWVLLAEHSMKIAQEAGYPGVVITDVRFHNEADMILRNGGDLWYVMRPDAHVVNEHVSEQADWHTYPHRVLHNDGTLDDLFAQVDSLMGPT